MGSCWRKSDGAGAEKSWELGRDRVVGMIGPSEVIGDCEWVEASSARTKYEEAAAHNELAVAETHSREDYLLESYRNRRP